MPNRGLIIAIENYPASEGLFSRTLSGTHQAAKDFYRWLVDVKKLDRASIFICSDGSLQDPEHPITLSRPDGSSVTLVAGASRSEVIRAITSLIDVGQDQTEELYVYFSGHGFGYQISQYQLGVDVLITSEFHKQADSGGACLKLDELRARLYMSVGGRDHYYIIDACRNVVTEGAIQVLGLGISPPLAQLGFPTMYTLYSVRYGESAPLNAKFPTALKSGLSGTGHAKGWVGGEMYVKFDLLCDYVDDASKPPRIDSRREGNGSGTLVKLPLQSVLSDCVVTVDGASANDRFELETISGLTSKHDTFTGPSFSMKLEPNDRTYSFRLTSGGTTYELYDPPPTVVLDFYASCVLKFRPLSGAELEKEKEAHAALGHAVDAELSVTFEPFTSDVVPSNSPEWQVDLESLQTGKVIPLQRGVGQTKQSLPSGAYVARLREDGVTAARKLVRLQPGATQTLDLVHRESTPIQAGILQAVNSDPQVPVPDFSETLGPTAHWDLQLWLAYLGAAHIMKRPDMYYKLGQISLDSLDDVSAGQSVAFVLAVAPGGAPKFAVHQGSSVSWSEMNAVGPVPDLYQGRLPLHPGSTLISILRPELPPLTFASGGLPNRATLFVLAPDVSGRLGVQQFFLPLSYLPQQGEEWWDRDPRSSPSNLKLVGLISLAQRRFALRKPVAPGQGKMQQIWEQLLQSEWTDPVFGLLALYDTVRTGVPYDSRFSTEGVLRNLTRDFRELPDVAILRRIITKQSDLKLNGVPLFLDGLLASRLSDELLPLPTSDLDFNSSYTSWRNAVTPVTAQHAKAFSQ